MSSDNQANQETNQKINTFDDPLAQRAMEIGQEKAKNSESEEEKITIELTKVDADKLSKLMSRLALRDDIIVESAISLVRHYVVKEKRTSVDQLEKKFLGNGNTDSGEKPQHIKLSLSAEGQRNLKDLEMDEKVSECVRIAINLYDDVIHSYDLTQNSNPENHD
ncbi:hypothetical protein [Lyngbya sp. PCC 8106]|uniref:hypothetical protein n=1 Tax=Lyngbya sp. (strain PCC 8106) TaxID=313612 RepID=UPI0000EA96E8|nr:hypothetical protein [Lyngbya sp. PCC 8106]EAW35624.1 hypothetical protein L8106_08146 [Lyngbya sp. PCC 8106]